jgi:LysR family glycine cleavage system transcriptional activator
MRKLPSLNAARAFECAGRHLSFQQAAEELHVTPSAVSHQVKLLESDLGVQLFDRFTRRVELTPAGRQYLMGLSEALDMIDESTRRVRAAHDERVLTLAVAPSFATAWLVPHLLDFQERYPDIQVRLASSLRVPDFHGSDVDLALLLGPGDWRGLYSERLTRDDLIVLCAPSVAEELHEPDDLARVSFIRILARPGQWRSWLHANGLDHIDPRARGIVIDSTSLGLEAAVSGLGVVLADRGLASLHVAQGHLVMPFEMEVETERGYHLVCPRSHLQRPAATVFVRWLRDQLALPVPLKEVPD